MMTLIQAILFSYAALFPIVNPVGSSVIFLSLIKGSTTQEINNLAFKISLYLIVMLLIVLFVGSLILNVFGVTVPIVLISGGLLLAHVGWQMLNKPHDESTEHPYIPHSAPIFKNKSPSIFHLGNQVLPSVAN